MKAHRNTWANSTSGINICIVTRTAVGKLERENAAFMKVQLVFVWFGDVQHFHITALHPHCKPLSRRTVTQRKDLHTHKNTSIKDPTHKNVPADRKMDAKYL